MARNLIEQLRPLGYYKSGRPIYPIQGGAPDGDDPDPGADEPSGDNPEAGNDSGDAKSSGSLGDPGKKALDAERAARKAAEKTLKDLQAELDKVKQAQLSESEKAIAKARDEGKTEGSSEARGQWAPRLVRAEFKAASAGRLTLDQVNELLEDLDLSKYITDEGEVDETRIAKKIDALAPAGGEKKTPPPFNGGPRKTDPKKAGSLGEAIANRLAANKS